ncbi:hypothetical protein [Aquimarina algiphila]|uniref:Uncharacterized protein n=1 Tax=Aquimarina algiphila TaxID=2047982 RepID=A0A554VJS0_9FLAO|nr:hypothetical protein [Aquimarina algiphila]TSE08121.1 hypothetical protein FOF46_13775 [Aquimarina algiphila]
MKNDPQLLYKVMRHFVGMQKIEVFDFLQKIEVLLLQASSPLTKTSIRDIMNKNIKPDNVTVHFTILSNGNLCYCIGSNDWLEIYKEQKTGIGKLCIFNAYYFKIKNPFSEIKRLTADNLLESFKNTKEEIEIIDFLRKHRITKKEKFIEKLLLLDVLNKNSKGIKN